MRDKDNNHHFEQCARGESKISLVPHKCIVRVEGVMASLRSMHDYSDCLLDFWLRKMNGKEVRSDIFNDEKQSTFNMNENVK